MKIKDYTEKDIRNKILSKISPTIRSKRSKHPMGEIYVDGKYVAKVKIPNSHQKIMKHSKSQYIARDLKISNEDFNRLIDCPMKRTEYYDKLSHQI